MTIQQNQYNLRLPFIIGAIAPSLNVKQLRELLMAVQKVGVGNSYDMFSYLRYILSSMIGQIGDLDKTWLVDSDIRPQDLQPCLTALIETMDIMVTDPHTSSWNSYLRSIRTDETNFTNLFLDLCSVTGGVDLDNQEFATSAAPGQQEAIANSVAFSEKVTHPIWYGLLDIRNLCPVSMGPRSFKVMKRSWAKSHDNPAYLSYHLARAFFALRDSCYGFHATMHESSICEAIFWRAMINPGLSLGRTTFKPESDRGSFYCNNERYLIGCRFWPDKFHLVRDSVADQGEKEILASWDLPKDAEEFESLVRKVRMRIQLLQ